MDRVLILISGFALGWQASYCWRDLAAGSDSVFNALLLIADIVAIIVVSLKFLDTDAG